MSKIEADLVLKGGKYLDVHKREFVEGEIAIKDGKIIGINKGIKGKEEKNITGKYVVPGFIDGHIHLESSVISPENFSKIASIHGTTSVVTDPHEIANVCGINGIKYMLQKTENLPISVYFMASSCVPATEFDESAATLDSKDIEKCFEIGGDRVLGLAEMMNYPGVIAGDKEVLAKINVTKAHGKRVDGHAPMLKGKDLETYIAAGVESDHECSTIEEAMEKIDTAKKMGREFYIMIRQGTAAKNLSALAGLMSMPEYRDSVMFSTDDKHPEDLKKEGHIDYIIRKAIEMGIRPEDAYVTASYNAAQYFGLDDLGKIEEGATADFDLLDDDRQVKINSVYKRGMHLTSEMIKNWSTNPIEDGLEESVKKSIKMRELTLEDIRCKGIAKQVIGLVPGQIITTDEGAEKDYDLQNDIIKVVAVESHKGTMHIGIAYLKGMGLKKGAIGTTVSHDSHNLILAGTNDADIVKAANEILKMQGGKIYVEDEEAKAKLPLPIAGLMTEENPQTVIEKMEKLKEMAKTNEGIDPFMNLSFASLPVIGDIRLLPGGAFDSRKWGMITQEELNEKYEMTHEQNNEEER